MNGMPYPYPGSNMMPQIPNQFLPPNPNMNNLRELQERILRLERQVKRLEAKVFKADEMIQNDYSASPPKDSGMYMV